MTAYPWSKFFWSDWEADQGLRLCSLAAQGLWMRMLCVCARHEPKGYLSINGNPLAVDAIARLAGVSEAEAGTLIAELETNGVFSRNRTGSIYSRRMVRDERRSQEGRKHKKRGLSQANDNNDEISQPARVPSREASPQKPEAISQKDRSPNGDPPELAEAVEVYRAAAERCDWPIVQRMSKPRLSALRQRLREAGGIEGWRAAISKAEASDFLCNRVPSKPFTASFDFLTQQSSFTKLMEGNYDNRGRTLQSPDRPQNRTDPALEQALRLAGLGRT